MLLTSFFLSKESSCRSCGNCGKLDARFFAESFPSDVGTVENCFSVFHRFHRAAGSTAFPRASRTSPVSGLLFIAAATASSDILKPSQAAPAGLMPTTVLSEPSALQLYLVVRGGIQLGMLLEAVSASCTTGLLILSLDLCSGDRRLRSACSANHLHWSPESRAA